MKQTKIGWRCYWHQVSLGDHTQPQRENPVDELVVVAACSRPGSCCGLAAGGSLDCMSGAVMPGSGVGQLTSFAGGGSCSRPRCCGSTAWLLDVGRCGVRQQHGGLMTSAGSWLTSLRLLRPPLQAGAGGKAWLPAPHSPAGRLPSQPHSAQLIKPLSATG